MIIWKVNDVKNKKELLFFQTAVLFCMQRIAKNAKKTYKIARWVETRFVI